MALYTAEFFKTFNKLASKITASLNLENYDQYLLILSQQMNQLITKHQYSHQLSKWSYIHDNLGPAIKDWLDDDYFKAKYSSPNTNNNYTLSNSRCLSFYDLLYLVHQHTTSSDHVKLVQLAENMEAVEFQTTFLQNMPTSIATARCHFYLNFLKTIFTPQNPLTSINSDCHICLDTKTCIIGYFKCKHNNDCSDCYDQLNNKCCMLCRSTWY